MKTTIKSGLALGIALSAGALAGNGSALAQACATAMKHNYNVSWTDTSVPGTNTATIYFHAPPKGFHHNVKVKGRYLDMVSDCVDVAGGTVADFALHDQLPPSTPSNHLGPIVADWMFTLKSGTNVYKIKEGFLSGMGADNLTPGIGGSAVAKSRSGSH